MELILDKNKKREHLYLEVFHYYRELIMEKKPPARKQDALSSKMFAGTKAEPHHH
mgnify:CR=1 FL=1